MMVQKQTAGVVMLLIFIISLPSFVFLFRKIQETIVRYEMQEKLEHSRLHTVKIPANAVMWYEKNKEIIINGKLFDVASYQTSGDFVIFSGLFDDEETEIRKEVTKLLQKKQQQDATGAGITVQHLFAPLFVEQLPGSLLQPFEIIESTSCPLDTGKLPAIFLSRISPPPKI